MATGSTNDHPDPKFVDSETALGGADAVEKTTYVVGEGTDPNALSPSRHQDDVHKRLSSPAAWLIAGIIVLLVVVYALGGKLG
jgi:hypothetical protein